MGSYWIPSNKLKGEGRILYIFTPKSLIYTGAGAGIGFLFYLIFYAAGIPKVGYVFIALLAFIGFAIGTFKVPQIGSSKVSRNLAGDSLDDIIKQYIRFKKNKRIYSYAIPRKEPDYMGSVGMPLLGVDSKNLHDLKERATKVGLTNIGGDK